ncbi:MAG: hypothetical protein ACKVW3_05610 [Phycisphaerales bacterium]
MKQKAFVALVAVQAMASMAAMAQAPGDILFTDEQARSIRLIPTVGVPSTLHTFADPTTRLAGITQGGDGQWYVANGPFPVGNPSASSIIRVANLFSAPSPSIFNSSDPLQNPHGLVYDAPRNRFLAVNNPIQPMSQPEQPGILAVTSSSMNFVFTGPGFGAPPPSFRNGTYMVPDPNTPNDYIVMAENGGMFNPGTPDGEASTMWRLTIDPGTGNGTMTLLKDLSTTPFGVLANARGITAIPGTRDFFITDVIKDSVYKVTLDNTGVFSNISLVQSGLNGVESIIFNPYTNKLVLDVSDDLVSPTIQQMNLDGSGLVVLTTGHARGFAIVPTPASAAALLGAMGLSVARRRRK